MADHKIVALPNGMAGRRNRATITWRLPAALQRELQRAAEACQGSAEFGDLVRAVDLEMEALDSDGLNTTDSEGPGLRW